MKRMFLFIAGLLLFSGAAIAQPGPGPGPTPNPWVFNGAQIYYSQGCVTVSTSVPGPCHSAGSFTANNLYAATTFTTPTPFTLGATSVTTTGVQLNYLSAAAGTTGTASTNIVFSTSPTITTPTISGHPTIEGVTSTGATGAGNFVFSASPTLSGTVGGTAILPLTGLATIATNTVLGNATSGTAAVAAQSMSSCSTSTSALIWTTNTGFGCNTLSSSLVTTLSFGTTGLTPNSATSGAITVAGTLIVANGGTGAATLTGVLKGNGTSAFTAATAGSDFVAPGTATTFTALQSFVGTSSNFASSLVNAKEPATISATAATGTINYDVCTQSILYYTTNASANWTLNLRCSSGTSLNTAMSTGDVVTVTFLVTQGASPFYNNVLTVDGGANTPKCQGSTCPSAGNASGVDAYTYAIIKTANATFTVLESQTQFK